jgi:glycosyltransferase involved in cell wall biosynthesis
MNESQAESPVIAESLVSIVLPVYNEGENIQICLRRIEAALGVLPHELLVCYDFDQDTTLPAIEAMPDRPASLRLVKNDLGRGVLYALQAGFRAARGDAVITTMADLSDPPEVILAMVRKIREEGADVVSGSRYMKGGSQTGGPFIKRTLSRLAGLGLHWLAGIPTHDCTTNFRAYSTDYLRHVEIESKKGFEVALELTVKAHVLSYRVDEVPSSWTDRSAGQSRFRLWAWLPHYLRWAFYAVWGTWFRRKDRDLNRRSE